MTEKEVYDYIIDGSNVLYESKEWGDEKTEIDGEKFDAINVDRVKLAVKYFEEKGYKILVCVDFSTAKKVSKYIKPSKSQFTRFIKDNHVIKIPDDSKLIELKQENPGSKIITNDSFASWISGDESVSELTIEDWEKEKSERLEFGFNNGEFTLARKNSKFTKSKELPIKPKNKQKVQPKEPENSNYLDNIRSRLQSLDDRTQSQTTKINNINSIVQDLSTLVQDIATSSTPSNSSALIPCKFEDEFGQSHLCLLGENLHLWKEGKWIEIAIGENTKLLD